MTDDRKYIYVKGKKVYVSDELLCYRKFFRMFKITIDNCINSMLL